MAFITLRQANVVTSPNATIKGSPLTNAEVDNNFANINVEIGVLSQLTTSNTGNLVSAVNELQFEVDQATTGIGVLSQLTTSNTSNLVAAVNEVDFLLSNLSQNEISNGTSNVRIGTTDGPVEVSATLQPNQSGAVDLGADANTFREIKTANVKLFDPAGDNHTKLIANTALASNLTFQLPGADGTAGQALITDGSGSLSFAAAGATLADEVDSNTSHYIVITTSSSGSLTTANVSTTKLFFTPNTGVLNATDYNSLSDLAYKENLSEINQAVDIVKKITGFEFNWKDNGNKSAGVIAQELEMVLPHLVKSNPNGSKTVSYGSLTAYLIQSIKELSDRIEKLESKDGL